MKKIGLILTLFVHIFGLSSCQRGETTTILTTGEYQVAESSDENFRMILYSEKDVYLDTEEVNIWGTIEYIGKEDSIDIYSGSPYAGFNVVSDDVAYIQFMTLTLLQVTTLEKGEVYEFSMEKSGGFSETDADADFWRAFYLEESMLFPQGEYQVTFSTGFYTEEEPDFKMNVTYEFNVN